ncbi:MAG: dienelactone hydrolase family protein, partial [Achromobacter mucicolens]
MSFSTAAGNVAPTVIHTDTQGLVHGDFKLPVTDGSIDAYYAAPEGQRDLPVVLVIQEIFGVHEHIKDICRRFAKLGHMAIAPALYARQGDTSQMTTMEQIRPIVSKVPD